jgi:CIC family chloride channel protein
LRDKKVADLMKFNHLDLLSDQKLDENIVIKENNIVYTDSLEVALNVFEGSSIDYLFVINPNAGEEGSNILGVLYHLDVLKLYNDVLTRSLQEEHS